MTITITTDVTRLSYIEWHFDVGIVVGKFVLRFKGREEYTRSTVRHHFRVTHEWSLLKGTSKTLTRKGVEVPEVPADVWGQAHSRLVTLADHADRITPVSGCAT